jgi:hypothetical protein
MADENTTTPEHDTTTPEDVEQSPRANPEPDPDAVERGEDVLERVKPY